MEFIITLIAGAIGGNVAGGLLRSANLGVIGSSVAGVLGGGLGGQVLMLLDAGGWTRIMGGGDAGAIIGALVFGTLGGGAAMAILGVIRRLLAR